MNCVVDASVAVKWFVRENMHEQALALINSETRLIAPDFIVCEITNTLWKKCIRREITTSQAEAIAQAVTPQFSRLYPAAELNERALEIGLTLNHPIYDCLYIACAERSGGVLVTDDRRLLNTVAHSDFEEITIGLGDPDWQVFLSP